MPRRPDQSEAQGSGERLIWALVPGTLLGKVDRGHVLGPHNLPKPPGAWAAALRACPARGGPPGIPINPFETQIS